MVFLKTENIKRQNEQLLKYAHANAHHVRGPIARLLGLIQLTKLKTKEPVDYPWFFDKVEYETKAVDEILHRIALELQKITKRVEKMNEQEEIEK